MIKTRFAPSPTGMIHIGNLRTALYSYLIARHNNGKFILRIEDTDKNRSENKYINYIYDALKCLNIDYDEGPLKDKGNGPYIQSERKEIYLKYAKELIKKGKAYYCFCPECKKDEDRYKKELNCCLGDNIGYNGHCRNLTKEEIDKNLQEGKKFVIRQKIPKNEKIKYNDLIYGNIEFETNVLEDQILIKSDGYPTYNFANVIDDHLMEITHVVRGNEYLSSTPKYVLLYQDFDWEIPNFIHLPLIFIKDEEGKEVKMSKRFGSSSFANLINQGYLCEAIINYIFGLGCGFPLEKEIYSLQEMIQYFDITKINNCTKVLFEQSKLDWFNKQYILKLSDEDFVEKCKEYCNYNIEWNKLLELREKIIKFSDLNKELIFLVKKENYDKSLFWDYKKNNFEEKCIVNFFNDIKLRIKEEMTNQDYYDLIKELSIINKKNFGIYMHLFRVCICTRKDVIISACDVASLIGKNEVLERINNVEKVLATKCDKSI